jgi:hypothetical protein
VVLKRTSARSVEVMLDAAGSVAEAAVTDAENGRGGSCYWRASSIENSPLLMRRDRPSA